MLKIFREEREGGLRLPPPPISITGTLPTTTGDHHNPTPELHHLRRKHEFPTEKKSIHFHTAQKPVVVAVACGGERWCWVLVVEVGSVVTGGGGKRRRR
ncbi:hypothetical protein RHGRI_034387 [Rhododendron griersonianum]|uniref:Uncharacterized protein n=1 Tax=Rhododendron griersonianum TaxID=479676 RepID=A0AAV6I619_9ERIC|nr:hypothetical protein RHGRI_034387 [Rhododendron griersonianum]